MKVGVYSRYGLEVDGKRFTLDHVIPIELGGADTDANLWPEPTSGTLERRQEERLADRAGSARSRRDRPSLRISDHQKGRGSNPRPFVRRHRS
jgi:hypothetical protein